MRIQQKDIHSAERMGEGYYYVPEVGGEFGDFYHLWKDTAGEWHIAPTWTLECSNNEEFIVLPNIERRAIKMDHRHFEAIKRVDAPAEQAPVGSCQPYVSVGVDWDKAEEHSPSGKKTWYPGCCDVCQEDDCATEAIIADLIMARTVSDAETAIGYVRDPATGDIFKVTVEYLGNNPNGKD